MLKWEDLVGHVKTAVEKGQHGPYTPDSLIPKETQESISHMSIDEVMQLRAEIETKAAILIGAGEELQKKSDELTTSKIVNTIGLRNPSNERKMVAISGQLIRDTVDSALKVSDANRWAKVTLYAKGVDNALKTEKERTTMVSTIDYKKVIELAGQRFPIIAESLEAMTKECTTTIKKIDNTKATITDTVRFYQEKNDIESETNDKTSGLKDFAGKVWSEVKGIWQSLVESIESLFDVTQSNADIAQDALMDVDEALESIE
jgi:hypothetical protein